MKIFKTHLVKFLKPVHFEKPSENAYDLSKFLATILCSHVHMSAAESLGSNQLNSFAAFLKEKVAYFFREFDCSNSSTKENG